MEGGKERGRETGEREWINEWMFHLLLILRMATTQPGLWHSKLRSKEFHPGYPLKGRDPSTWTIRHCLPLCISRNLDCKRGSWNLNWHSNMGCWLFKWWQAIVPKCWIPYSMFWIYSPTIATMIFVKVNIAYENWPPVLFVLLQVTRSHTFYFGKIVFHCCLCDTLFMMDKVHGHLSWWCGFLL